MSEHHPSGPPAPGQPNQPPPPPGQPLHGQAPSGQAPYGQQPPAGQQPYGQQPPYAPPSPSHSQVGQPADLMTRFLARLIDFLVVGFVAGIIYAIFMAMATVNLFTGQVSFWPLALSSLLAAAISLGYFAFLESSRGQTLGKMVLKIQTFAPGGGHPSLEQALRRNAWTALGALGVIPVVGATIGGLLSLAAVIYIAVTINNDVVTRQGWHDTFAGGTSVVRIG